jgi:regulator of protease activity HflC (stomatin/prohibitin superfamily)
VLKTWSVLFHPILTAEDEQSDFLVKLGGSRILIEEKTKLDDPAQLELRGEALSSGKPHLVVKPLVRSNRLSGIVGKAVRQLKSSSERYEYDFALVWFTGMGLHGHAYYEQFIATLYGRVGIIEMNSPYRRSCYFFQNSEFHRHAAFLDGAVAARLNAEGRISIRLCPNPLSPRATGLRRTRFAKLFGTAVDNPRAEEREGRAYILESDTDRRDEGALLGELQAKYGTQPLQVMHVGYHHFAVRAGAHEA